MANGSCYLLDNFIEKSLADHYLECIKVRANWQQPDLRVFGRNVRSPRLSAWYGDKNTVYRYSGITNYPLPWFKELREIQSMVESYTDSRFNSVLLNLYRDGGDSMGYHSDDESELGREPLIASISLGETRRFILKHKSKKASVSLKMDLSHGSLLVMAGETQHYWQHSVPKTRKQVSSRINLTFRWIDPDYYRCHSNE